MGASVGPVVGASVGMTVGEVVGASVGPVVGSTEGGREGVRVGVSEGASEGAAVGFLEGLAEGLAVGERVGLAEGFAVGSLVGCFSDGMRMVLNLIQWRCKLVWQMVLCFTESRKVCKSGSQNTGYGFAWKVASYFGLRKE